jgi:hypothetical protein
VSTGAAVAIGVIAGFVLASYVRSSSKCCDALGRAALKKYNVPDLGPLDATAGGVISELNLI